MYPEDKKYTVDPTETTDPVGSGHSTHFENPVQPDLGHPLGQSRHGGTRLDTLSTIIFYLSMLFFIIGFNFRDVMVGNWYQQFLPNITGAQLNDVTFTDSLTGFSVTDNSGGSSYILKTINGGENWVIKYKSTVPFRRVIFINQTTGFVNATRDTLYKTTDAGESWQRITLPTDLWSQDMAVLNQDTIWLVLSSSFAGGVFRTTNGGASWQNQLDLGSQNPDHVYFYNGKIGFTGKYGGTYLRKTTNSGLSWTVVESGGFNGFSDMYFIDSLTGYRAISTIKKTTDGGLSWVNQVLPQGGQIITSTINKICVLNRDTVWGVGGWVQYPNLQSRGLLYRTTNGGDTWKFQVPDTTINIVRYSHITFTNKLTGWAYSSGSGIHTTNGGDTTFYLPIHQISTEVPNEYRLFNNYPNPFNPETNIGFRIAGFGLVTLKIFDVNGREDITLINEELKAGEYKINWNASAYSSGVYFYKLTVTSGKEVFTETKRMMLIK